MKHRIVADGEQRLFDSPAFNARMVALKQSVQARYAARMAEAGFFRRLVLRWQIRADYQRERKKVIPSASALYLGNNLE